jgi:conjugal transfer/entry exclusion protein
MTQKTISDMIRETVGNTSEFFNKIAEHIEHLENTISQLQEKITQYENLTEEEIDDHK